jgi:hypothetical protein
MKVVEPEIADAVAATYERKIEIAERASGRLSVVQIAAAPRSVKAA